MEKIDLIEYTKFEKYMLKLKELVEDEQELDNAFKKFSPEWGGFSNEKAIDLTLTLLKELVNDKYGDIDYFIYELEWGKKWYVGCVTSEDGKDIPMATIKDLYNFLKENYGRC